MAAYYPACIGFLILNGLTQGDALNPGEKVKIVTE